MKNKSTTSFYRVLSGALLFSMIFILFSSFSVREAWSSSSGRFMELMHHNTDNEIQPGDLWIRFNNKGVMAISANLWQAGVLVKARMDIRFRSLCQDTSGNGLGLTQPLLHLDVFGGSRKSWQQGCEMQQMAKYADVAVAKIHQLQRQCDVNNGQSSFYKLNVKLLTDDPSSRALFNKFFDYIEVQCSDDYVAFKRPASVRAHTFNYSCDEGFVIQGTNLRYVVSPYATDPKCVRPEDTNNYEIIHDRPRSGGKG